MIKARGEYSNQLIGKVAFCLCSYRAGKPYSFGEAFPSFHRIGQMLDRVTALPFRQFVANNRDYTANPRNFGYQLGLAKEILSSSRFSEASFIIDKNLSDASLTHQCEQVGSVEIRDITDLTLNDFTGCNTVILVYPDALGLGWSGIEHKLFAGLPVPLFIANGRRRLMRLDSVTRRALAWRRLLATSRLTELCLSLFIIPLAMFWAAQDALRGKS